MGKYYRKLQGKLEINLRSGSDTLVPGGFRELSSIIISQCSFLQKQLQHIIYVTHGPEIISAKKVLNKFPSPKARMDFITSFPYNSEDTVVSTVFKYSQKLFSDIYEVRNILAHEQWMSSDEYHGSVLFSQIDEEARLMMASSKLLHREDATTQEVHNAIIRYIQNIKIMNYIDLQAAAKDTDLCAWILVHINNVIDDEDEDRRNEARRAFFVFKGTSHLFEKIDPNPEAVNIQRSRSKKIQH